MLLPGRLVGFSGRFQPLTDRLHLLWPETAAAWGVQGFDQPLQVARPDHLLRRVAPQVLGRRGEHRQRGTGDVVAERTWPWSGCLPRWATAGWADESEDADSDLGNVLQGPAVRFLHGESTAAGNHLHGRGTVAETGEGIAHVNL